MSIEETQSITATHLARNIAQTIDAVRMSRTTVLITKGAKVIAQLSPPPKTGLSVQGLIDLLKSLPGLTPQDSKQLADEVKKIRTAAKLADNPWD